MIDFMLIMILVLLFGTQYCFNKTWNANMNEEQRNILKKFTKHKAKVVSKMSPLLLKGGIAYALVKMILEPLDVIPKSLNAIILILYCIMLIMPFLIKSNKLTKKYNQQIEKLYTDENIKQSNNKIYPISIVLSYISTSILIVLIFSLLNK